jgi:hypothetical protein
MRGVPNFASLQGEPSERTQGSECRGWAEKSVHASGKNEGKWTTISAITPTAMPNHESVSNESTTDFNWCWCGELCERAETDGGEGPPAL